TGLVKEQLKVSEDNTPQDIVYFSEEDLPLHVGILLDGSGAAKDELKAKALPVLTRAGGRDDEFFTVEAGKTPLNDAVLQTINTLAQPGNTKKRALVLLTTRSDPDAYPFAKVRDLLKELDIQLYVIALQASSDISNDSGRQMLRDLAERSGGNAFFPSRLYEQADICKKIMAQLKNQYLIGFRSTNRATDGKWRKIKITGEYLDTQTKKVKKIEVHAKPGYYAPK